jgi:hypothetical protein
MKSNLKGIMFFVLLFTLVSLACGGSNTETKVGTSEVAQPTATSEVAQPTSTSEVVQPTATSEVAQPAVPEGQSNKPGDVVSAGNQTITLNSYQYDGVNLKVNFTIENKSGEDFLVSSLAQFEASDSEGTKLDMDINLTCLLDGVAPAGGKLEGDICWKGTDTKTVKVYYKPDILRFETIAWELSK